MSRIFAGITYEDLDKRNLIMIGDSENLIQHIVYDFLVGQEEELERDSMVKG